MKFVKGRSGNPTGRPAMNRDIRDLAREHTIAAIAALVDALDDPKSRVEAAKVLLDRGYGKVQRAVEMTVTVDDRLRSFEDLEVERIDIERRLAEIANSGQNKRRPTLTIVGSAEEVGGTEPGNVPP